LPQTGEPTTLKVRALGPDEAAAWDALAGEGSYARCAEQDRAAPDGSSYLVAWSGDVALAALRVGHSDALDVLRQYHEADERARAALADHLAGLVRRELLTWSTGASALLLDAVREAGFVTHREKVFVEHDLADVREPETSLALRSLAAIGERAFVDLLYECAAGDPFEDRDARPREEQYADLVRSAGTAWDPEGWLAAFDGDGAVGAVLPQPYPDDPRGSIFYVGVVPERRARGHGTVLHAHGLWRLSARGAASYVGSTDVRNEPMRRVFARNGCRETKRQIFLRRPG